MTGKQQRATLDELESLLEAFGAEPNRWPAHRRPPALALLAEDAEAQNRVREARALEAVIDCVAKRDPARLARLADRIVAEARGDAARSPRSADPAASAAGARVIRLEARRPITPGPGAAAVTAAQNARSRLSWRTAAALAASLVLGVAIGLGDMAPTHVLGLTTVAEATPSDAEVVLSALQNDRLTVLDEEQI